MGILKNLPKSVVQVLVFFHNVVNTLKTAKQVSDFFHNAVNISKIVMQQKKSNSSSSSNDVSVVCNLICYPERKVVL